MTELEFRFFSLSVRAGADPRLVAIELSCVRQVPTAREARERAHTIRMCSARGLFSMTPDARASHDVLAELFELRAVELEAGVSQRGRIEC